MRDPQHAGRRAYRAASGDDAAASREAGAGGQGADEVGAVCGEEGDRTEAAGRQAGVRQGEGRVGAQVGIQGQK